MVTWKRTGHIEKISQNVYKITYTVWICNDIRDLFLLQMEEIEYSCEKCNGKAATVTHKFSKLPRYLHIDRVKFICRSSLHLKHAVCLVTVQPQLETQLLITRMKWVLEKQRSFFSDGSFLPTECSSYTWNGTVLMLSCLWTASWASRWWFPDTWPCCPTALNSHDPLLVSAGVPKPPCKTSWTLTNKMFKEYLFNISHSG